MTLVIGTDEAGYGPNLGPLVVAATAWRVDTTPALAEEAVGAAGGAACGEAGRLLWADSKRVLRGGTGFAALETGALVGLALASGGVPTGWPGLVEALAAGPLPPVPEHEHFTSLALPCAAGAEEIANLAARVGRRLAALGVAVVAIRARVVQPAEFNALLAAGLNKSDLLSRTTLELAASLMPEAGGPVLVWCDRHGGRRRYAGLVGRHFGAALVRASEETAVRSVYEVPEAACRVEFTVGGEDRVPVALASMTAKYVRELAMRAFNGHWSARCPGLAPTAGYPVDAVRWRREAAPAVEGAGLDWDAVWRRA